MELIEVILKLIAIASYLGLAVWWWVTWQGMHNNTIDGNTFRLIYPFIIFDKTQFTEKGNYWRIRHLYANGVAILFSTIYWSIQYIEK